MIKTVISAVALRDLAIKQLKDFSLFCYEKQNHFCSLMKEESSEIISNNSLYFPNDEICLQQMGSRFFVQFMYE